MKGGGSEMPAKRKMRKERRKDKPKKKTKKMLNTSPCFCFNLCYTEGQHKAIRKKV